MYKWYIYKFTVFSQFFIAACLWNDFNTLLSWHIYLIYNFIFCCIFIFYTRYPPIIILIFCLFLCIFWLNYNTFTIFLLNYIINPINYHYNYSDVLLFCFINTLITNFLYLL